jgi:maltose O-acetyltransferase
MVNLNINQSQLSVLRIKRVLCYLWTHFVLVSTFFLPDLELFMRFRGWLLGPSLKFRGKGLIVAHDVHFAFPNEIVLKENVYLANGVWLLGHGGLVIEEEVLVGPYCVIVSCDHTKKDGSYFRGPLKMSPVQVGRGSWLGANSVILKGSSIGAGSVVCAGSVVSGRIPESSLVVGVPGRVMGNTN